MTVRIVCLLVCLSVLNGARAAGDNRVVPVYEEPYHRLIYETDNARIFNTSIPAGDTSRYHRHENPTQYVILSYSLMRNQDLGGDWSSPDPDSVPPVGALLFRNYAEQPQEHRVDNAGEDSFQVIGVINYTDGGEGTAGMTEAAESGNPWFDVHRYRIEKGKTTGAHRHDNPVVVIQVSAGRSYVLVDGRRSAIKTVRGNWSWHEAGVGHRLGSGGDTDVELVEIEVKQPHMSEE